MLVTGFFIVTCQQLAEEGDTQLSPPARRGGPGPPGTIYTLFTPRARPHLSGSSCTSPPLPLPPLHLCTHNPWSISHTLQGSRSSNLQIKSGAPSPRTSPHPCPHQKARGTQEECWGLLIPSLTPDLTQHLWLLHAGLPQERGTR